MTNETHSDELHSSVFGTPAFDPFGDANPEHAKPGNEATRRLHATGMIWTDLMGLAKSIDAAEDARTKKLLLKYVCVELISLNAHIGPLGNDVIRDLKQFDPKQRLAEVDALRDKYRYAYRAYHKDMKRVRDSIAAHRDEERAALTSEELQEIWGLIDEDKVNAILHAAGPLLEALQVAAPIWAWTIRRGNRVQHISRNPLYGAKINVVEAPKPEGYKQLRPPSLAEPEQPPSPPRSDPC